MNPSSISAGPGALLMQGVVPDYRLRLFEALHGRIPGLRVAGGKDYFQPGIVDATRGERWHVALRNRYFLKRRLMWQSRGLRPGLVAETAIGELNPRLLTICAVAAMRALLRKPFIFWGHVGKACDPTSPEGVLRRALLQLAHGFVAYTEGDRRRLRADGYSRPVWVTNNSCLSRPECAFTPGRVRTQIIYVGRLVETKKVALLLRAFEQALDRLPAEVGLLFVGDGPERAALERSVRASRLQERVVFAGHRSDPVYLREAYSRAFAAASPGYVGLSVIQALGFGVPVLIARDEPHSPEIEACVEFENALFFASDEVDAAASAIGRAWIDRRRWEEAGPRIARKIAERYTLEAMTDALAAAERWQRSTSCEEVL